jgi:hypothetical protein
MTKERPILFSAPMVCALLAGTKTQTRRVVKWRGLSPGLNLRFSGLSAFKGCAGWYLSSHGIGGAWEDRSQLTPCPYGQPGDRLWVREAWARTVVGLGTEMVVYGAGDNRTDYGGPWKPSIHMPRAASRITLEVTGVRVERLQDISEADAQAEGIPYSERFRGYCIGQAEHFNSHDPRESYRSLWQAINGPDSWAANPWVWVVEFKRAKGGPT